MNSQIARLESKEESARRKYSTSSPKGVWIVSSLDDNQETYMVRKMKKFMRSNNFNRKQASKLLRKKKQSRKVWCFNCDKEGHIKENCLKFKKKGKENTNEKAQPKSKVHNLKATWDDTSKESKSKQTVGLAFMTIHNEVENKDNTSSDESQEGREHHHSRQIR